VLVVDGTLYRIVMVILSKIVLTFYEIKFALNVHVVIVDAT
jgi:hypothetical protein